MPPEGTPLAPPSPTDLPTPFPSLPPLGSSGAWATGSGVCPSASASDSPWCMPWWLLALILAISLCVCCAFVFVYRTRRRRKRVGQEFTKRPSSRRARPQGSIKLTEEEFEGVLAEGSSIAVPPPPQSPRAMPSETMELPPGWEVHKSDAEGHDGQPYFFNVDTGESLWEHPSMRASSMTTPASQSSFELDVPRRIMSTEDF